MRSQPRRLAVALAVVLVACSGHRPPSPTAADDYRAIVAAPDRTDGDRALDAGRNPAALLAFAGIRPGMRVAELMAGGGYTTELLARAVAPDGRCGRRTTA